MKTRLGWWVGVGLVVSLAAAGGASAEESAQRGEEPLVVARVTPASVPAPACYADQAKGDGGACSSDDECDSGKCEGGSCCTKHGDPCDSTSHCCGHQSCKKDGTCP